MKVKLLSILLFTAAVCWIGCSDTDGPMAPGGKYDRGVFVVNEGPFGGSGSITWYDPLTGDVEQNIFSNNNNGAQLGEFVQSLNFYNGKAYIVVNGANKIVVVDASTFEFQSEIDSVYLPRYMSFIDDNVAWISEWGPSGLNGSIKKINLNTGNVMKALATGNGPDKLFRVNNTLYVPNSGGFGVDSTVSIFDLNAESEVERRVVKGKNPNSITFFMGEPWVLCAGSFLDPDPVGYVTGLNSGIFFSTAPYGNDILLKNNNNITWASGGSIWSRDGSGMGVSFINQPTYGLGYDPDTDLLYAADPKDFSSAGEVFIYDAQKVKIDSFPVGIAPGEIVIR